MIMYKPETFARIIAEIRKLFTHFVRARVHVHTMFFVSITHMHNNTPQKVPQQTTARKLHSR